jgi:hypothetical protein
VRLTTVVLSSIAIAGLLLAAVPDADREGPLPSVTQDLRQLERSTNDARAAAVEMMLQARSIPYELEPFSNPRTGARRSEGVNIVVTLGRGTRDLIVGAHFDAATGSSGLTGGALDNGAGVVTLVRLAERLRSERLRHRVRLVFFDMEETGLHGSKHHVSGLDRSRVAAAVNIDVVGVGDTVMLGPSRHRGNDRVYAAADTVCAELGQACMHFPSYAASDDISFQRAGIPNLSVGLLPQLEAHQFWLQLNGGENAGLVAGFLPATTSRLHTASDTADAVDPAAVTRAYDFLLGLIRELDASLTSA